MANKIVVIDAGHGDKDCGAVNGKRYEKDDNLQMALEVKNWLRYSAIDVYLTRVVDTNPSLADRVKYSNSLKPDYFISLHENSHTADATGIEAWVVHNATQRTLDQASGIILKCLDVANARNRGVKKGYPGLPRGDFYINKYTNCPSCLLELLFISNPNDMKLRDKYFNQYAKAIAQGICEAVGVPFIEKPQTHFIRILPSTPFRNLTKEAAEAKEKELKALGIDCEIAEH